MIHNDVLRRLRYALAINDTAAISIFKLVNYDMEIDYLHAVMKREGEEGYLPCRDKIIALFLDGLIIKNRGRQEGQEPQELGPKERLSNNEVLRKIRIAMSYKDDDMIEVLKLAGFRISKGELSAFFRKPDHRNFKPAGDQVVRNLLQGMVKKYRPESTRQTTQKGPKNTSNPVSAQSVKSDKSPSNYKASNANDTRKRTNSQVAPVKDENSNSVWGKLPKKQ
ncbi:MAG: DUF1456 family protein [Pseudomonadota bacterium]|jgi:uncharacterized protein YehS (DUF1456 family)|nr:DUF1456 family protein [Pseudomonadota bacterium]|tara:strand:- start:847 stop:1515 length:669 start_codon:yes stop_codon:yes gene_type:complete